MALIVRIDVDRPYGKAPVFRHMLSRLSSDVYLPRLPGIGYLAELGTMLEALNRANARAYVFFRRCTLPFGRVLELLHAGKHEVGLHLENSRSYTTFREEIDIMENHFHTKVLAISKHGSGKSKFGFHHYAPYEPAKYIEWAERASMRLFLGNLEDPTLDPIRSSRGLLTFPSAFWLEPHWRDTERFPVEWLMEQARERDIVMLVHPENVLADPVLNSDFETVIRNLNTTVIS